MTRPSLESESNSFLQGISKNNNEDEVVINLEKISDVPKENRIKLDNDTIFSFSYLVDNDHIILTLNEIGAFAPYIYKSVLTLDEIQEKYKMFKSCDNLKEVEKHIGNLFKDRKIKLKKEKEDAIIFELTVFNISHEVDIQIEAQRIMTTKKDDVLLQLYKIEKDQIKLLKEIEESLKKLGPDGNNLMKKINEFKQNFE